MKLLDISTPKYPNTFTRVDEEDYEKFKCHKWLADISCGRLYAKRTTQYEHKKGKEALHREILRIKGRWNLVDHIDGDSLNNQKINLRICTSHQNTMNCKKYRNGKSAYKGVNIRTNRNPPSFRVRIRVNYILLNIGEFSSEIEAAKAYNEAAKTHFGEFARLNVIPE